MSLKNLYEDFSVSPWCDDLSRELINAGHLHELVHKGVRGVTTNPTIFANAVSSSDIYLTDIKKLSSSGKRPEEIYWDLAVKDTRDAADVLRPLYAKTNGEDGYVSLEVSPRYAHDHRKTIQQARYLWATVRRANIMIKIPATTEGLLAITKLTSEGMNINATLIFSLHRYLEVMNAYLTGLESRDGSLRHIHSVASFFVSRIDTAVDLLVDKSNIPAKDTFSGRIAIAQSHAAYGLFLEMFNPVAHRWRELINRGANLQRPLWASTSVKNQKYHPLLYVNSLLLPCSVNTMPIPTLRLAHQASVDSWKLPSESFVLDAHQILAVAEESGINMKKITSALEKDGIRKFENSYASIIKSISDRV